MTQQKRTRLHARLATTTGIWLVCAGTLLAADRPDEARIIERIDRLLDDAWNRAEVTPALPADDATFMRRVSLDLTGVIPTVSEVRRFLDDPSPDKRRRLVEELLRRPDHATHLARVWREIVLPSSLNQVFRFGGAAPFENWLQSGFAANRPYDQMVRELLTTTAALNTNSPALFYSALEFKPEELAGSTSRIFLGVQIQCAQCHDHPFDHWTQEDFWSYAAFFAQLRQPGGGNNRLNQIADAGSGDVKLPETDEVVPPRFLGTDQRPSGSGTRRSQLAKWLTSPQNPFLARATVNRVWAHMFGRGLVNPVDDFGEHNAAVHPEVLDVLAADFVDSGFDMRRLLSILAMSRAYQLSSRVPAGADDEPELFQVMSLKSLTADQIFACLMQATARRDRPGNSGPTQAQQAFLVRFEAPTQTPTELQSGIPQALTMLNGSVVAQATNPVTSDLVAAVGDSPFLSQTERVDVLFLAALSRLPTQSEKAHFTRWVTEQPDADAALADVLWTLLNSTEFVLNR